VAAFEQGPVGWCASVGVESFGVGAGSEQAAGDVMMAALHCGVERGGPGECGSVGVCALT
jgi:hypothetical protein